MSFTTKTEGPQWPEIGEASFLSSKGAAYRVDYHHTAAVPNESSKYSTSDAQLGTVFENEAIEGGENGEEMGEEPHDQFASFPHGAAMDVDLDRDIVSKFVEKTWDEVAPTRISGPVIPLQRASTTDSVRSARNSLKRAFTSSSTWSVDLDAVHHWEFSLEEWAEFIRNHSSIRLAEIVKVDRYVQKTVVPHRFLVLQLRRPNKSRNVFLRLDRRPVSGVKFVLRLGVTPANDCALLAADEKRAVRGNTPANVEIVHEASLTLSTARAQPMLHHLELILSAMSLKMTEYRLTKENCWFFCGVCLTKLFDTFGGKFNLGRLEHTGLPAVLMLRAPIYSQVLIPPLLNIIRTPSQMHSIDVSHDGNQIVSCHHDNHVRYWDVQTGTADGEPVRKITSWVVTTISSPSGRRVVSGLSNQTILLSDLDVGTRKPLRGHTNSVESLAFSPNERVLATGSKDKTIRLWDTMTGNVVKVLLGHADSVLSVAFSPSGQYVASGSADKTVRTWDIATGIQTCQPMNGHIWSVKSVAYAPDERYIVSGSSDGVIRFWDAMTGTAIGVPLRAHSGGVTWISFFPDGRRIASCGQWDSDIYLWDVPF